jgi:hypothetical protein
LNKPFNLAEALAGKPVVNGRGDKVVVTKLALPRRSSCKADILSQSVTDGDVLAYHTADGNTSNTYSGNVYTLYMAPVEKEAWVNLYEVGRDGYGLGRANAFSSRRLADEYPLSNGSKDGVSRLGGKAVKIVYEE